MKVPHAKIEQAAAKDDIHYYLNGVFVDAEKQRLVATDNHILAVHKATDLNGDKPAIVPTTVFKAARVGGNKASMQVRQQVDDCNNPVAFTLKRRNPTDIVSAPFIDGKFPDIDRVIPEKPKGEPTLCLNAELLYRLKRALTAAEHAGVKLWLPEDKTKAIYVEPLLTHKDDDPDAFGLIMPMRY